MSLYTISQSKHEQLLKEQEIDRKLSDCASLCPNRVIQYFLVHRELSRKVTNQVLSSSMWEYPERVRDGINTMGISQKINTPLPNSPVELCFRLPEMIRKLEDMTERVKNAQI